VRGELPASGSPALPGPFPGLSLVGSDHNGSNGAGPNGAGSNGAGSNGSFQSGRGWEGLASRDSGSRQAPEVVRAEPAPADEPLTGVPTGSPPWPPAEPVFGADDGFGGRTASPWFQTRRQVIPGSAQVSDGVPAPVLPHRRAPYAQPHTAQPQGVQPQGVQPQNGEPQAVPLQAVPPQAGQSVTGPPLAGQSVTGQPPSVWDARTPTAPMPAPTSADATKQALPRRQRQANLAPQLRDSGPAPIEDGPDGSDGPNPDGSRALVESLQYGLDLARSTPASPDDSWPGGGNSWPGDPWQPADGWPSGNWPAPGGPDHTAPAEDAEGQ
jgi:hypothetical protein